MEQILHMLNSHYAIHFERIELLRDMGSAAYAVFAADARFFLRSIKPAFHDTAVAGADMQIFLQNQGFPVTPIIFTRDGAGYVKDGDTLLILYSFIEGEDCDPERDAEALGELAGRLHSAMKAYPGGLVKRDKQFYIGRYLDILRQKQYPRAAEYIAYGEQLWEKLRYLPQGCCHGDLYCGNIRRAVGGTFYVHDFDTSCVGLPMYDVALLCDRTNYFQYEAENLARSKAVLARFVPAYREYNPLSEAEIDAFPALIAMQHFATQATVMEFAGIDCLSERDIDNQLDWLYQWRAQAEWA